MKNLHSESQKMLRLRESLKASSIYHRIQVAYPFLRKIILTASLVVYAFLAYFGNLKLMEGLGYPSLPLWRTGVTMVLITIMVLVADGWMRRYFQENKWKQLIPRLLILILVVSAFRILGDWVLIQFLTPEKINFFGGSVYYVAILLTTFLVPIYLLPLHLADGWIRRNKLQHQLEQQSLQMKALNLEAELKFLRAQIHPHFLFNVLNNIYSLIEIEPPQAQHVVLKLSAMMQYMLYDCREETVSLEKEIQYLNNYIELHQLKKDGEMNISFETKGVTPGMKIPPMLLVPLIENVFKHGNLEDLKNGWMKAVLTTSPTDFHLSIQNSFTDSKPHDLPGGIGLENIRERLSLLYPDRHTLIFEKSEKEFTADLHIQWKAETIHTL